jgi:hypothetical protein
LQLLPHAPQLDALVCSLTQAPEQQLPPPVQEDSSAALVHEVVLLAGVHAWQLLTGFVALDV